MEGYLLRASAGKHLLAASELLENMDGQRDALVSRLHEEGIGVLDLTPAFQAAAARGEKLYWSTDNHWAPAGNELAARIMEDHIRHGGGAPFNPRKRPRGKRTPPGRRPWDRGRSPRRPEAQAAGRR